MQIRVVAALVLLLTFSAEAQVQRLGGIVAHDLIVGVDNQIYAATETGIALVTPTGLTPVLTTNTPVYELEQLPDGTFIYFTANALWRAPAGGPPVQLRSFTFSHDGALTRATDGAVWFSLAGAAYALGRIAPNGTIFDVPQQAPTGHLAPGAGGAVWTAGGLGTPGFGNIALVTPAGQVTAYSLPQGVIPLNLAPAPGGSVYIAASGGSGVLLMTPGGSVTTFLNVPSGEVAVGPDGAVYLYTGEGTYVRFSNNQFAAVTDPHAQAMARCFEGYTIMEMVVGPDGTLWAAQQVNGVIILLPPRPQDCPPSDPVRDAGIVRITPAAFAANGAASVPSLSTMGLYTLGIILVAFALLRLR